MKVTKAYEISSNIIRTQKQISLQKDTLPKEAKRFDEFTATQTEKSSQQNLSQTVEQVADVLHKQYKWISFTFKQLGNCPEDIAQFIVSADSGIHLVIAPDMLEWMAQGKETWTQGIELINKTLHDLMLQSDEGTHNKGAIISDNGEITFWSAKWEKPETDLEKDFELMTDILERQDEARKQKDELHRKMKLEHKKKLNYQMGKDMTRLAKGTTERDVRSLISHMYANRQKLAVSSSYNKKEVQIALAQIDYVIGRARAKIRHLKDEETMQVRVKKAEKQKQEKRRMQLELELKNRRRNRIAKERAAIYKKMPDLPGLRNQDERREAQAQMMLNGTASGVILEKTTPAMPAVDSGSIVVVSMPSGGTVEVTMTPMA